MENILAGFKYARDQYGPVSGLGDGAQYDKGGDLPAGTHRVRLEPGTEVIDRDGNVVWTMPDGEKDQGE